MWPSTESYMSSRTISLTSVITFLVTGIIDWMGYPGTSAVKNLLVNAGDVALILRSGRSPGEGADD